MLPPPEPPPLPQPPETVDELERRLTQKVMPLVYNDGMYARLYQDYELLLQRGNGQMIRNEIVDAAHSIGNVTAYYTLKMTTADTYELTVHVSEDKKMLGSERNSASYTYTGNHNLANDIKQYWDLNSATWDRMAAAMGFNAEAGQRPSDGELSRLFLERFQHVLVYLANNMVAREDRYVDPELVRIATSRDEAGAVDAYRRLYDLTVNARMAPNSRQLSAARWFHNRKLSELGAGGNLRYVPHSVYGAWNRFPFNGDLVADCFKYLNMVEAIKETFVGCLLQMSYATGGAARDLARQEYRREFGDASAFGGF